MADATTISAIDDYLSWYLACWEVGQQQQLQSPNQNQQHMKWMNTITLPQRMSLQCLTKS